MTARATTLQAFFTDRLARQRQASPNTIAAYRDTLRLLLVFAPRTKARSRRSWTSTISMPRLSAPSSTTSSTRGKMACAPATLD